MSLMYEVDKKTVRTWNVMKGCEFNCVYCVQREQAKRQKHRCAKCYSFVPHMHPERLNEKFKAGETVFVAAAGDISFATFEQFHSILKVINLHWDTTFYIQSKNPAYFNEYLKQYSSSIRSNTVLGTTIESNFNRYSLTSVISKAPPQSDRKNAMLKIPYRKYLTEPRKYVTIEPVLDFDHSTMVKWMKQIAPDFVYVGYINPVGKAKKLQLPEPSLEQTMKLCKALEEFTEVRLKTMREAWWNND